MEQPNLCGVAAEAVRFSADVMLLRMRGGAAEVVRRCMRTSGIAEPAQQHD